MNLEQQLRALAADDANTRVPAHLDAAVMAAWDERRREQTVGGRSAGRWQIAAGWVSVGAFAVVLVVTIVVIGSRAGHEPSRARRDTVSHEPIAPAAIEEAPQVRAAGASDPLPQPGARVRRPSKSVPSADAAYVLVPDAGVAGPPLTVMRVRMSRGAFSRLGVPIANPDAEGMVDVEVLVGEDGVARSIRRAATVGWVDANR